MMFERLVQRAERAGAGRAERRRRQIAESLSAELPEGIAVAVSRAGVALSGHGLKRRIALDPALRALTGGLE